MENIFENFTTTILKINKLIHRIKNIEMREYGLKTIHVMCVYYLNFYPEGLTAADLSKRTLEDKAAISRALKILKENGYVCYDANGYNAIVRLTAVGKQLADYISDRATKAVMAGSYSFNETERMYFYNALNSISDNLENYCQKLIEKQ